MPKELDQIVPEAGDMRVVSRRHAAELLDCSLTHIDALIASGELESQRVGVKAIRIPLTSLKQLVGYPTR